MWCPVREGPVLPGDIAKELTEQVRKDLKETFNAFFKEVRTRSGRDPTKEELEQFTEDRAQYDQSRKDQQHRTEPEIPEATQNISNGANLHNPVK